MMLKMLTSICLCSRSSVYLTLQSVARDSTQNDIFTYRLYNIDTSPRRINFSWVSSYIKTTDLYYLHPERSSAHKQIIVKAMLCGILVTDFIVGFKEFSAGIVMCRKHKILQQRLRNEKLLIFRVGCVVSTNKLR